MLSTTDYYLSMSKSGSRLRGADASTAKPTANTFSEQSSMNADNRVPDYDNIPLQELSLRESRNLAARLVTSGTTAKSIRAPT